MSLEATAADVLAAVLMAAPAEQCSELRQHGRDVTASELAWALKRICYAAWTTDPPATLRAAELIEALARQEPQRETQALAAWTRGIALLAQGQMEAALTALTSAGEAFAAEGRAHEMAQTQISRVMALAMLGRHDEALACGTQAREVFDVCGDTRSAGKVEVNLGNLAAQRDQYPTGAQHFREARARLHSAGDTESHLMATTGLADMLARQHDFAAAEKLYDEALQIAQCNGYGMLTASIEGDIGALEMRRGRYGRALHFLERSRMHFEALDAPHYLAVAEESLGDAYLELNLLPEALALYDRSLATYEAAGMQTDQAWGHSQRGRALTLLARPAAAAGALSEAHALFLRQDNAVGLALVSLWRAELALASQDGSCAAQHAQQAQTALLAARQMSWHLHARGVLAQALRISDQLAKAESVARQTAASATAMNLPQPLRRAQLLLGTLARERGDSEAARVCFESAVASIESQRGTLPGEEFRSAFLGDKLQPYRELVGLSLAEGGPRAAEQALAWMERARARTLADPLNDGTAGDEAGGPAERDVTQLRASLNACYRELSRPLAEGPDPARLLDEVRRLEAALLESGRRRALHAAASQTTATAGDAGFDAAKNPPGFIDISALQRALGTHTALVEYFSIDEALLVIVVTDEGVQAIALAVSASQTARVVERLRFQTDTLRHATPHLAHRLGELRRRALHHLQHLHTVLWAPLTAILGERRAVVVPHGALHYLPFEALFDGRSHEIERREMCRCASASVLLRCLERPASRFASALVMGHADERLPQIGREVQRVAALLPRSLCLLDGKATSAALRTHGPAHDVLHIACHAQFRNDSPRFSALHLADGAFTVRDAARLNLQCGLLTLSACETGVSAVMPGDELIGLTHGFMSGGATSVLASLWTVGDDAAGVFMEGFYSRLLKGHRPASALRESQCEALGSHPHPYFWSAFSLHGGW